MVTGPPWELAPSCYLWEPRDWTQILNSMDSTCACGATSPALFVLLTPAKWLDRGKLLQCESPIAYPCCWFCFGSLWAQPATLPVRFPSAALRKCPRSLWPRLSKLSQGSRSDGLWACSENTALGFLPGKKKHFIIWLSALKASFTLSHLPLEWGLQTLRERIGPPCVGDRALPLYSRPRYLPLPIHCSSAGSEPWIQLEALFALLPFVMLLWLSKPTAHPCEL